MATTHRNSSYNGNTHTNTDNPENQPNSLKHLKHALPHKQSKLLYSLFVLLLVNKIIWSLVNPSNLSQSSAISSWSVFIIIRLHLPRKSLSTNWRSSSLTRDQHLAPDLMEPGWEASWCFSKLKVFFEKCEDFMYWCDHQSHCSCGVIFLLKRYLQGDYQNIGPCLHQLDLVWPRL